jgi:uncharacterized protein with PQ loop repeat
MEKNLPIDGLLAGYFATICFTVQYIPQTILNFKRKSVKGFSTHGILIKLIGASFLCINSIFMGENIPVILYGLLNVIQHIIFMFQFGSYNNSYYWYGWILFPIVPYYLALYFPITIRILILNFKN